MFETLFIFPLSFWVVIGLLVGGGFWTYKRISNGTGLPMLVVLGTTAVWYVGDAFYNDYANNHAVLFTEDILESAWWQVAWFLTVFLIATPLLHDWINGAFQRQQSGVLHLFQNGINYPQIQRQLNLLFQGSAALWVFLLLIALLVLRFQVVYYVFPFLGFKASPWVHGQIGSGFDCFAILAVYLQLLSATMFGVVAALATDRSIRRKAVIFCLLAWPYFIFDRARNSILAMVVPAILCWVFLRLRGGVWKKAIVLLACFLAINVWMKFVIANRSNMSITQAFSEKGLSLSSEKKVHNEGLNMFEELCWVSTFLDNGKYKVNWGARYFAELVNPIPRGLWHNKPLIGLDYAIARGHFVTGPNGTVDTTISTGFIGQGVVNFGRILGPAAAAVLMGLWTVWLARMDLTIQKLGRLPLYSLGLILTFNLGRDITLLNIYPFVFGALAVWWLDRHQPKSTQSSPSSMVSRHKNKKPSDRRQSVSVARRATSVVFNSRKY